MTTRYVGSTDPLPTVNQIRDWIDTGLRRAANDAQDRFEATTTTWETDVDFSVDRIAGGYEVGTDSEIYGFVNYGTRPHTIRARDGGTLAFQEGYRSKTLAGLPRARDGGPSGAFVYAREVQHPGTQARDFDQDIGQAVGDIVDSFFGDI